MGIQNVSPKFEIPSDLLPSAYRGEILSDMLPVQFNHCFLFPASPPHLPPSIPMLPTFPPEYHTTSRHTIPTRALLV
jgi:hypothetical protein